MSADTKLSANSLSEPFCGVNTGFEAVTRLADPAAASTLAPAPARRPAPDALVERYLEHVRVEKRLAARTVELYALDLQKLMACAAAVPVALPAVQNTHVRRWVVAMRAGGRSGLGIALVLSGWRGFHTWLGRQGLVPFNPVQDVRAPRAGKPLPKALSVDDAVQLESFRGLPQVDA